MTTIVRAVLVGASNLLRSAKVGVSNKLLALVTSTSVVAVHRIGNPTRYIILGVVADRVVSAVVTITLLWCIGYQPNTLAVALCVSATLGRRGQLCPRLSESRCCSSRAPLRARISL